jgi:RsmE family RNA methyltransferase
MFIPTIFNPDIHESDELVKIGDDKLHHIKKVLRKENGSKLKVTNGQGLILQGKLHNKDVEISSKNIFNRTLSYSIFLPHLRERNRFRFMLEKLTELNSHYIFIGSTENSQKTNIKENNIFSWLVSAIEQSGTPFIPEIEFVPGLDFDKFTNGLDISGKTLLKNKKELKNIAIGPEGGWSKSELANFKSLIRLTDNSLRTETAAITAASLML